MKVKVTKKEGIVPVRITTEYIKLEAAMKLSSAISGGAAKTAIQLGEVAVAGEICTMRGKKLYPGDVFTFDGVSYQIVYAAL